MNLFYFFQKYLDKKNEFEFRISWEKFVHSKIKRFIGVIFLIWILGTILIGYFVNLIVGFFLGFIIMLFFSAYFGYILFIQTLKFLAINNTRYIQGQTVVDENVMNYEDVVDL